MVMTATLGFASSHDDSIPMHPLRIKPLGNPSPGRDSHFMHALCRSDELWKAIYIGLPKDHSHSLPWRGSWRSTVRALPKDRDSNVDCGCVFSDVLHRPFACTNINLSQYVADIPETNLISRFDCLTYEDFAEHWTERPFILTRCIRDWPACTFWTLDSLLRDYADVEFRAEAVDWTLRQYWSYMNDNQDESPLYLFDRKFVEKMKIRVGHEAEAAYWRPDCFGPDLLEVLGMERPAHRWLIAGPKRSGSTFHKDPNGTSAWNAVIQGAKYWIMFPPAACVPGVYVSADSSEVTSPLSIAEWLLTFHREARRLPGCVEGVCLAGEVLHVPSGWWHLVVNLESGIAVTQNFVPLSPSLKLVSEVLSFLRDKPDQVSGFPTTVEDPYGLLVDRLREAYPDVLDRALYLSSKRGGNKRKWDTAVEEAGQGFSFGFGVEDDIDVP
ncbi:cyclin F-box/Jumonji domain-containing protein [Ophiocordyceps camponoti-floridani]|uniref:Cyclin F-box/Jumonji domain-containing protein n=1 Tax=Ophiocordyceps camponoti-floridani TaxID=2030778 RepID=A0A8H4QC20_9HYPO|nr:cyclin F-box/Jumonji domain-containing protein [Ophiocordyceps camponoti-floridani]